MVEFAVSVFNEGQGWHDVFTTTDEAMAFWHLHNVVVNLKSHVYDKTHCEIISD